MKNDDLKQEGQCAIHDVSGSYSAPFCKACKYWTVIDVLGDYCTKIKECVASPRPKYKHKDCPL